MAGVILPNATTVIPENWTEGNISKPWSQFIDYLIPTRMPIDEDPVLKSAPRWTAVLQPGPTLAPRFARLELSLPDRILGALPGLLANPGAFSFTGAPLWSSDIPDNLATHLDCLPTQIGMAGRGYSGKTATTDVRMTVAGAVSIAVRGLARAFSLLPDTVTVTNSHQPNSWRNDWSMVSGDRMVLVGQDCSYEIICDMPGLQSGLALQSSSTHEGLPAVLVQVCVCICLFLAYSVINAMSLKIGYRMLAANVRFAILFSTTVFRLVEIGMPTDSVSFPFLIFFPDSRLEQGHALLVSPAYRVSSEPSEGSGALDLEPKPLLAILTALVLAGLWPTLVHPAVCELEPLEPVLLISAATNSPETEAMVPGSGVSAERVRR